MFRPTAQATDNIALLESGFNKEIAKATALLQKQENETDAYSEIKAYLDQEADGLLQPEAEVGKPAFKLYLAFKQQHVSFIKY